MLREILNTATLLLVLRVADNIFLYLEMMWVLEIMISI